MFRVDSRAMPAESALGCQILPPGLRRSITIPSLSTISGTIRLPCFGIYQNRVVKPKLGNARRDLSDLRIGVRTWIPGERDQPIDQPHFDVVAIG